MDHREDLLERVERRERRRDLGDLHRVQLAPGAQELLEHLAADDLALGLLELHEARLREALNAGLVESREGLVRVEDGDRLSNRRLLVRAQHGAVLKLLLLLRAAGLEVAQELLVRPELLRHGRQLRVLGGDRLGVVADRLLLALMRLLHLLELRLLHSHEVVVLLLRLLLRSDRALQVRLERVKHVLEHAHDLTGLRVVVANGLLAWTNACTWLRWLPVRKTDAARRAAFMSTDSVESFEAFIMKPAFA